MAASCEKFALLGLACGVALLLGGCVAMNTAAMVSSATIGTANAVGRAASQSAAAVSRSVSQIPAAMMYGASNRRIVVPVNRAPAVRQAQATRVARQTTTRQAQAAARQNEAALRQNQAAVRAAAKAAKTETPKTTRADTFLEVLPPEVLDQLSQDQINLQAIVQAEALKGDTDETIFWELDERAGTARAEPAHTMGAFTCRAMIESVKLGETATEARATACRTTDSGWTLSF